MARRLLIPTLPGSFLAPLSGADELTAAEESMIANLQAGTYANETPIGAVDSSNNIFTLAAAPSPAASLRFYINGALQAAAGEDYTLSSATITTNVPPDTGDILRAWYLRDS